MTAFFKDLFEYHYHFNQLLIEIFIENKTKISHRTLPLFSHCLNAHNIWNARISETEAFGVHQLHPLENFKTIDSHNLATTLNIIDTFDLNSNVNYQNSKGDTFENSVQDILFHIANHFTHHKGQLISDLRQKGIAPPVTDYIFYKR